MTNIVNSDIIKRPKGILNKRRNEKMVVFNMVVKACPLTNGIVTVDGRKMDFVIHKGQLILSDSSIKPERVQEIKERLKTITMNAYKVSSFNS